MSTTDTRRPTPRDCLKAARILAAKGKCSSSRSAPRRSTSARKSISSRLIKRSGRLRATMPRRAWPKSKWTHCRPQSPRVSINCPKGVFPAPVGPVMANRSRSAKSTDTLSRKEVKPSRSRRRGLTGGPPRTANGRACAAPGRAGRRSSARSTPRTAPRGRDGSGGPPSPSGSRRRRGGGRC